VCVRGERREEAKGRGRRGRCENTLMARCVRESSGLGTRARRAAHCGGTSLESEAGMCKDTNGCTAERPSDAGATHEHVRHERRHNTQARERERSRGCQAARARAVGARAVVVGRACRDGDRTRISSGADEHRCYAQVRRAERGVQRTEPIETCSTR
jgi:hypothetical protein